MHRHRSTWLAPLLILALSSTACSSDDVETTTTTPTTTTTTPSYDPVFQPGPCDAERVPPAPAVVECGTLVVPEDRSAPTARQVRLPVAIVKASVEPKQPDPIIYFSGGPGNSGLSSAKTWSKLPLDPTRDVMTFDQRGTGTSEPSLECAEVDDATYALFETADPPADEAPAVEAAFAACHTRLTDSGINLSMYNTPTVADDVEDLRIALGVERWNIFGISYGTTVALEMLRSHPGAIRSAVLDSVYPTDITMGPLVFDDAERVFNTLVDGCAKDAGCAAAHPDLRAELQRAVDLLDAKPYALDINVGDRVVKGLFTGTDLIGGLFNSFYDETLIPLLPLFIGTVAGGNFGILDSVAQEGIKTLTRAADGQTASVDCADRQRLVDRDRLAENIEKFPLYGLISAARPIPQICPDWEVDSVEPAFNTMPRTEVPTLVFGNEYDPVTPPANSERTAKELGDQATFLFFPGLGHGATGAAACPAATFRSFVADPSRAVDASCAAAMPPPAFVSG